MDVKCYYLLIFRPLSVCVSASCYEGVLAGTETVEGDSAVSGKVPLAVVVELVGIPYPFRLCKIQAAQGYVE